MPDGCMTTAVPDQQRQPPPKAEADAELTERLATSGRDAKECGSAPSQFSRRAASCETGLAAVRRPDRAATPGAVALDGWRRRISVRS
jgi:hypothetical protein